MLICRGFGGRGVLSIVVKWWFSISCGVRRFFLVILIIGGIFSIMRFVKFRVSWMILLMFWEWEGFFLTRIFSVR